MITGKDGREYALDREAWLKWMSDPERRKDFDLSDAIHSSELAFMAAFQAGALAMREAAEKKARYRREMWSNAGGFGGHSAGARIIADDISSIDPATLKGE